MDWKTVFLSAQGRIRRQDFWIAWLVLFGISVVLSVIPFVGILGLALIYPKVCIYSTRLHDMGRSGWLQLIPYGVCLVCLILGFSIFGAGLFAAVMAEERGGADATWGILRSAGGLIAVMSLAGLASMAFLIWVGATPGQEGDNRFGSPPAKPDEVFS